MVEPFVVKHCADDERPSLSGGRMLVQWKPYTPGDDVAVSPSGYYWVVIEGRVEIGTREYGGAMTEIWRTDQGVDDLVTHWATMEWPTPPTAKP